MQNSSPESVVNTKDDYTDAMDDYFLTYSEEEGKTYSQAEDITLQNSRVGDPLTAI